jgi:hypothetical protein
MNNVVRVALPGYNALTDTDPDHFALYSDEDWVLIKESARGTGSVAQNSTAIIAHGLGYIPFYLVYCEVDTNVYRISNAFDPLGGGWRSYANSTNLYIRNLYSAVFTHYRYYIFYDNLTSGTKTITESESVFKVAKQGVDVRTSKDPNDYIFHSDLNTFKIVKEGNLNTQTVDASPKTFSVAHNQSSIPGVFAFAKFPDGYVALPNETNYSFNTSQWFYVTVDATNINFICYKNGGNYNVSFKYYIFEAPGS